MSFPIAVGEAESRRKEGTVEAQQPIERLLDVAEVAEILRCSRAQVYAMVAEGSLSKVPLPYRATRFTRTSVERLIRGEVA
jgi:excisionase family DNA binding protein